MAEKASPLSEEDKAILQAWEKEIDAEEAEDRELRDQAQSEMRAVSAESRAAWIEVSNALLKVSGLTEEQARSLAEAGFARARKAGAAQHERALAVMKKRAHAHADETKNLLAEFKKG